MFGPHFRCGSSALMVTARGSGTLGGTGRLPRAKPRAPFFGSGARRVLLVLFVREVIPRTGAEDRFGDGILAFTAGRLAEAGAALLATRFGAAVFRPAGFAAGFRAAFSGARRAAGLAADRAVAFATGAGGATVTGFADRGAAVAFAARLGGTEGATTGVGFAATLVARAGTAFDGCLATGFDGCFATAFGAALATSFGAATAFGAAATGATLFGAARFAAGLGAAAAGAGAARTGAVFAAARFAGPGAGAGRGATRTDAATGVGAIDVAAAPCLRAAGCTGDAAPRAGVRTTGAAMTVSTRRSLTFDT